MFFMKVVAPMAGICDSEFLLKLVPYGFNVLTLGGYNIDEDTIIAGEKIIKRGRKEFNYPLDTVFSHIKLEADNIKSQCDALVSCNLRCVNPEGVVKVSMIDSVDIVEINCHCRQEELLNLGCGQNMMLRSDLEDYVSYVVDNSDSKVSVKIRANVDGVDTLSIAGLVDDCGVDYLHVDAMKPNAGADLDLIKDISNCTDTFLIGNNSIKSIVDCYNMLDAGADGFSIARACAKGSLNFNLNEI